MDESVGTFLKTLDPADTSTGGGAASAIAGAMGAALVAMVARLSIGKDGMLEESFYQSVSSEAEDLARRLFRGGHEDELAFARIRAAYSLPKNSEEQKTERRQAIQLAMVQAARVPLSNGERCGRVLDLCSQLQGCSNPNAASDLECAGHLARAGVLGCVANVLINVPPIKDETTSAELVARAHAAQKSAIRSN